MTDDIRKYIKILNEGMNPLNEHIPGSEMETGEATGPVTKIEVNFLDGDDVEVEVYAKQGDELKRLMDLAGIFHKDKQGGTLASPIQSPMSTDLPNAGLGMSDLPGDSLPSIGVDGATDVGAGLNAPVEPELAPSDNALLPTPDNMNAVDGPIGGTDIPIASDLEPINDPDDMPELSFDMNDGDDLSPVGESGARYDYGHPNPLMGNEPNDAEVYDTSGHASKPVRYTPARSGDNPMVDSPSRKSLMAYMEDIQHEISEVDDVTVDAIGSKLTKGIVLSPKQKADMEKTADEIKKDPKLNTMEPDEVVARIQPDMLNPMQKSKMDKAQQDIEKDPELKEDDLEEKRRRYSFVQRVLPTYGLTPSDRMRKSAMKAARRGLRGVR